MKLVFWQNILSIHQKDLLVALSKEVEVWLVYEQELYESRKEMGWVVPELQGVKLIHIDNISEYTTLMLETLIDDYHIFSGINAYLKISIYFNKLYKLNSSRVLCFLERPGSLDNGIKKFLRELKYRYFSFKYKNIKYLLTPGGEKYLLKVGFNKEKVIPFSYFGPDNYISSTTQNELFTFIYVGSLIKRKNISLILESFKEIKNFQFSFNIVGTGPEVNNLKNKVYEYKIKNVSFLGNQNHKDVMNYIEKSDCLILPSLHDGWGYVVNEALSTGCSVICSDTCGVSSMVNKFESLFIFKSNNADSLLKQFNNILEHGSLTNIIRKKNQANFEKNLSGKAGALKLLEVIKADI
jgi:glycosyltransferase involved in cell wall biosynthesis